MKQAVAIRHVAFEDAGVLEDVLAEAGYGLTYLQAGVDDLGPADGADLLIVLGGPIGAYQETDYPFLTGEIAVIAGRIAADRPTLGLCLGSQLMAKAMGARVYPHTAKEIGYSPLILRGDALAELEGLPVLHWHGDTFDLPADVILLASTPVTPHQAFARGRNILALQFHPEVPGRDIEKWLIGSTGDLASAGISPVSLRADAALYAAGLEQAGADLFRRWLAGLD